MLDKNDQRLTAYALGELDENELGEVEAALEQSPELRQAVDEIRQATELIASSLQAEECPLLSEQQRETIEQLSAQPAPSKKSIEVKELASVTSDRAERRRRFFAIGVAASLLIALVGISALVTLSPNTSQPFIFMTNSGDEESLEGEAGTLRVYSESETPSQSLTTSEEMKLQESEVEVLQSDIKDLWDEEVTRPPILRNMPNAPQTRIAPSNNVVRGFTTTPSINDAEPNAIEKLDADDISALDSITLDKSSSMSSARPTPKPAPTPSPRPTSVLPANDPFGDTPAQSPGGGMSGAGRDSGPLSPSPFGNDARSTSRPARSSRTKTGGRNAPSDGRPSQQDGQNSGDGEKNQQQLGSKDGGASEITGRRELKEGEEKERSARKRSQDDDSSETRQKGKEGNTSHKAPEEEKRTWRRVKAIPNTSRLMVGDHDELPSEGIQANVVIDGFRARVLLDCYFYNNRARRLEGNFKLRLPDDASLYYFAFGETSFEYRPMVDSLASNGFLPADVVRASGTGPAEILKARSSTWASVKEARMVPREKAAFAYSEVVRRRVDPALVEWSGAGVFNARVFPLMPNKLHRIVVGYDVNLTRDGDDLVYRLDLPAQVEQRMVDLNVAALPGSSVEVTPEVRPFTAGGRAYYHIKVPHENTIEVRYNNPGSMLLTGEDGQTGDFFATRITPDLPAGKANAGSTHGIFLVDTSLSSNPDKFNVWLKLLEATLEKNRDKMKHFAVLFFNIESHWWKNGFAENTQDNVRELLNFCNTLALEGATDLRQALSVATSPKWMPEGELPFNGKPDMFLLSDGAVTWGEMNPSLLVRSLSKGWGGTLFAYKTGMTGTAISTLDNLARETGGAVFSVVTEDEVTKAATAHRSRPWELVDVRLTGSSDLLTAGRIRSIYPGQSLLLVGRGKPSADAELVVRRGDESKTLHVRLDRTIESHLAPRLYGQVAVGQLEDLGNMTEKFRPHTRGTSE